MGPDCCCCRHACVLLSFVLKLDMVARNYLIDLPKNGTRKRVKKKGKSMGTPCVVIPTENRDEFNISIGELT